MASSQGSQKYDVFLNFRGEDVRFNFVSYLALAFNQLPLNFFVDYKLKRGEHIKSALMEAIQDSEVAVTIFSKGYASSEWPLDELVKIMECRENPTLRQKVIPVFYHVTPSDVRNVETGVFAQDFANYENDYLSHSKVRRWKAAMKAAGSLSGRIVNDTSPEADVLIQIVDDVLANLGRNYPISNPGGKKSFHASIHYYLHVISHNPNGKLENCPNIQQQQRNSSIWTISKKQGLPVQVNLDDFLTSIRAQVEGSEQRSDTSNSHPSTSITRHHGVDPICLENTVVGYCFDLGNGNWGYGYPVDYGNGYCGYHVDLGNGNWSYYVEDRGNGYLYLYEWYVVEHQRQMQRQRQEQGRADQARRDSNGRDKDKCKVGQIRPDGDSNGRDRDKCRVGQIRPDGDNNGADGGSKGADRIRPNRVDCWEVQVKSFQARVKVGPGQGTTVLR